MAIRPTVSNANNATFIQLDASSKLKKVSQDSTQSINFPVRDAT